MERAISGKSQGEVIDDAISALYRETGTADDLHRPAKATKRQAAIQARAESDLTAQAVGREDLDYSDTESTPTTHVATLDAGKTLRASLRKEAREINGRNRVPGDPHWKGELRKSKDRKKE